MSIPPVQISHLAPASRRVADTGGIRPWHRRGLAAAVCAGAIVAALWQVPPLLDWSRYRNAIASYASARLGRTVTIAGPVSLSLLPRATLVAGKVTLSDRGDGVSATLGTMRLEISLAGLLAGRVVPRSLILDNPVATLPWPMPRAAPGLRPAVAREFVASVQGGVLRLGGVAFRDIAASFQTDPDTGAFDAAGSAMAAGLPWRFAARVGAPDAQGTAALTLTLDGQAPYGERRAAPATDMQGTGGAFRGRISPDGTVAGTLTLRGPDLSRLAPAPALAWSASGAVQGDSDRLAAPSLALRLGGSSGEARMSWRLADPGGLDLRAALDHVALGGWAWTLWQAVPSRSAHLPATLDLSAGTAQLGGQAVTAPHVLVTLGDGGGVVRAASAILPGGARLDVSGTAVADGDLSGSLRLAAPDMRQSLTWLDAFPQAHAFLAAFPAALHDADVNADFAVNNQRVALRHLSGHLDGSAVSGSVAIGLDARRQIGADLHLGQISLPDPRAWPFHGQGLAAIAAPFAGLESAIRLRFDRASVGNVALTNGLIDWESGAGGLIFHHLTGDLAGGKLLASGGIGWDGALADGKLDYASPDAASLPAAWRVPAAFWSGPFHVAMTAAGPPASITAQLRADLGDLRLETEARIDQTVPRAAATVTLRHPGAPRLLRQWGLPGAEAWLDNGSVAVLAHLAAWPGHVQVRDVSVSAASLRLGGALDADFTGDIPAVTGGIDADVLALPGFDPHGALPSPALLGWRGDVRLAAHDVLLGLRKVASGATARLLVADGAVSVTDAAAMVAGGAFTGDLALDSSDFPPHVALEGQVAGASLAQTTGNPFGLSDGTVDASFDVLASGEGVGPMLASAAGHAWGSISAATISGMDLPGLDIALQTGGARLRPLLAAGLSSGQSTLLAGRFSIVVADGKAVLPDATLQGSAGSVTASGLLGLDGSALRGRLSVRPASDDPPAMGVVFADGVRRVEIAAQLPAKTVLHRRKTKNLGGRSRPPRPPA